MRFSSLACAAVLSLNVGTSVGCTAHYDHTEITQVGAGALPQSIDGMAATLSEGDVLTAKITPYNTDDNGMIESVVPEDPSIVSVAYTEKDDVFAFLGRRAGTTHLDLRADGQVVDVLTVTVIAQP